MPTEDTTVTETDVTTPEGDTTPAAAGGGTNHTLSVRVEGAPGGTGSDRPDMTDLLTSLQSRLATLQAKVDELTPQASRLPELEAQLEAANASLTSIATERDTLLQQQRRAVLSKHLTTAGIPEDRTDDALMLGQGMDIDWSTMFDEAGVIKEPELNSALDSLKAAKPFLVGGGTNSNSGGNPDKSKQTEEDFRRQLKASNKPFLRLF